MRYAANPKLPTLEEFISSGLRNAWIKFKDLESYYAKHWRYIGEGKVAVLARCNTSSHRAGRGSNIEYEDHTERTRTGQYRELCELTERLAKEFKYPYVAVENVLNQFLGDKLLEMGYTLAPNSHESLPCYIKKVE